MFVNVINLNDSTFDLLTVVNTQNVPRVGVFSIDKSFFDGVYNPWPHRSLNVM